MPRTSLERCLGERGSRPSGSVKGRSPSVVKRSCHHTPHGRIERKAGSAVVDRNIEPRVWHIRCATPDIRGDVSHTRCAISGLCRKLGTLVSSPSSQGMKVWPLMVDERLSTSISTGLSDDRDARGGEAVTAAHYTTKHSHSHSHVRAPLEHSEAVWPQAPFLHPD